MANLEKVKYNTTAIVYSCLRLFCEFAPANLVITICDMQALNFWKLNTTSKYLQLAMIPGSVTSLYAR